MKMKVVFVTSLLVVAILFSVLGAVIFQSHAAPTTKVSLASFTTAGCTSSSAKITVTSTGSASATPDVVNVMASINEQGASAADALASDNSEAAQIISTVTAAGVSASDIQTTNFSLGPTYSDKGVITGYSASNSIMIKITNLPSAGTVIDQAENSIGNAGTIQSIYFSVSDTSLLQGQAKANAVSQANSEAQAMATAAGEKITGVCSISDSAPTPIYPIDFGAAAKSMNSSSQVPLQAGTQSLTDQVTVIYGLSTK